MKQHNNVDNRDVDREKLPSERSCTAPNLPQLLTF